MTIRRDPFEMMDRMFEQMRRAAMDEQARLPPMDEQPWFSPAEDAESGGRKFEKQFGFGGDAQFGFGGDANLRAEETEDGYVVMADLPGFEKDDITVRFEDGLLAVEAENETTEDDDFAVSRRHRRVHEALRIPGTVLEAEIAASYRNGVLEITVPTDADDADDEHVIDVE